MLCSSRAVPREWERQQNMHPTINLLGPMINKHDFSICMHSWWEIEKWRLNANLGTVRTVKFCCALDQIKILLKYMPFLRFFSFIWGGVWYFTRLPPKGKRTLHSFILREISFCCYLVWKVIVIEKYYALLTIMTYMFMLVLWDQRNF